MASRDPCLQALCRTGTCLHESQVVWLARKQLLRRGARRQHKTRLQEQENFNFGDCRVLAMGIGRSTLSSAQTELQVPQADVQLEAKNVPTVRKMITVTGHYRWSLLFNLEGPFEQTITESAFSKVSTKRFDRYLLKKVTGNTVDMSASASYSAFTWSAKASAKYKGDFQYHQQAIAELSENTETSTSKTITSKFEIPSGERRKVYYLVYSMPGVVMPLNRFTDQPEDVDVEIDITVTDERDVLNKGEYLYAGQSLMSSNGMYRLVMQEDGNLVLYSESSVPWTPLTGLWATNTGRGYGMTNTPFHLIMQTDGNLVVYDSKGNSVWSTGTFGDDPAKRGHQLIMQNDRNLVLYNEAGLAIWGTKTGLY